MSVVEISPRLFHQPFTLVVSFFSRRPPRSGDTDRCEDESRARRAFIVEMMEAHPEAFQHELDCQTMMHLYSSRF